MDRECTDSAVEKKADTSTTAGVSRAVVLLLAAGAGLAVASIYYAHPLLDAIRESLGLPVTTAGLIVTASQLGYGTGLALLVPLGDLVERRGLVVLMTLGMAAGLVGMAIAPSGPSILVGAVVVGSLSVVAQILVAFAATIAAPEEQGRVVGTVMSGLLLGILFARTASGYLAQIAGWRSVFWTAAGLMLALAAALRVGLPRYRATSGMTYPALIKSVLHLFRDEPVLRRRAAYGAIAFAGFSALWTPLAFLLSRPPYGYSSGSIGMFGVAGIAGALAASTAGRFADRGMARLMTGITSLILMLSWIPMKLGDHSVILLIAGIAFLDLAVQGLHITNQSQIYRLRPDARSRITSAYMTSFFSGGVLGSAASSFAYAHGGWTGVCLLGAAFGAVAVVLWLVTPGKRG